MEYDLEEWIARRNGTDGDEFDDMGINVTEGTSAEALKSEIYPATLIVDAPEDEEYRTPELVEDAIKCLKFCIDYCDTPERKAENCVHFRYNDLGRVYLATGNYSEAVKCAKASLKIMDNDAAWELLVDAEDRM